MPSYPLYICMFPICPHNPSTSISSPYVMGTWGHLYTQYVLGSFGGHQYICQAFCCLSIHPFASQFITVMPVAPHLCGLLLYWMECLLMSGMLHAVVPFFAVFIMSQASITMATTTPHVTVTVVSSGTSCILSTVTMAPPRWGFKQPQVSMMWFCHHC